MKRASTFAIWHGAMASRTFEHEATSKELEDSGENMEPRNIPPEPINGAAIIPNCTTKKKFFVSETEAVQFETQNREKYTLAEQFAYKCEDCIGWHLTAIPRDALTLAQSRIYDSSAIIVPRLTGDSKSERDQKVLELFRAGKDRQQIAQEVGCSYQTVCYTLRGFNDNSVKKAGNTPSLSTLEQIAERKKTLLAELERVTQTEQQLMQRKALKLLPCWNGTGILIEKEGNQLALALPDCKELVEKLAVMLAPDASG
jgi:hypothetical protein